MSQVSSTTQRLSLILLGLGFAILLAEAVFRIFPLPSRFTLLETLEGLWEPDDELLLHLKPELDVKVQGHPEFEFSVHTNQQGLRDNELDPPISIAAIGDSFTFGFGVAADESWPEQLERLIGVEVANLGWAGWNSYVYPTTIERYAIPLGSKLWVWMFFVNDLPESTAAREFLQSGSDNYLEWSPDAHLNLTELRFPYNLRVVQALAVVSNPELVYLPGSGEGEYQGARLEMRYSTYPWDVTDPRDPDVQTGWMLTEEAIGEAAMMARRQDADLLIVFAPSREQTYWTYLQSVMQGIDVDQLDQAEARLRSYCEGIHIEYLSLVPRFREEAGEGRMLYFPTDGHWSSEGQSLAAEVIYEYLVEHQLLPGE